ncbi:hypothetical protein [Nocardia sp. NPDC058633]|uniref:hypothetical protein n=1 Tax=Nocardia sp. NPDC058633 TaxID=3346568 RepID=UPI00365F74DD
MTGEGGPIVTGPNQQPPGDGVPPSDPTVAWWERPGEGAGQNPAQADPTVLRGNIGAPGPYTAPPTPYQSGANPQPYTAPPGPYQSGANPQPFPQPQPYVHPQAGAYQAPPPQWGAPPRPPSSGNKAVWWIVGGAIAAVGVLVIGLIAFAANRVDDDNPFGADPEEWAGSYVYKDGKNACDLVDLTVLNQWASTRETTTHTERGPSEYIGGGSYDCDAKNKDSGRNADDATLGLEVEYKTKSETESDYARWKGYDTKTTGKDYDHGPVSGLGSEAYYAAEQHIYGSIPSDYTIVVAAHDSNISVKVEIEVSSMRTVDKAAMRTAAETQVRKVLAALKK